MIFLGKINKKHLDRRIAKFNSDFLRREKGSKSTALYTLLYNKYNLRKGGIIPKHLKTTTKMTHNNHHLVPHNLRTQHHEKYGSEDEISPTKHKQTNKQTTQHLHNFLTPHNDIYHVPHTHRIINFLIKYKQFLKDMLSEPIQKIVSHGMTKTYTQSIGENLMANNKLEQLYKKFTIAKTIYNPQAISNIKVLQYYKLYHYIDNLVFAEFLSQILGIGDTNQISIDNKIYSIYAASLTDDLYHKTDLILQDENNCLIGIDLTIAHNKPSGHIDYHTTNIQDIFIANHKDIKHKFQNFYHKFTQSIYEDTKQFKLNTHYSPYNNKLQIEKRMSSIIHQKMNTTDVQYQDRDNNDQLNGSEMHHNGDTERPSPNHLSVEEQLPVYDRDQENSA